MQQMPKKVAARDEIIGKTAKREPVFCKHFHACSIEKTEV
jgi:hypothetical protein